MTDSDLIVVAEFGARPEADVLRAHLENSGIAAHVTADDMGGTFPGVGTAQVWVAAADAETATQLVDQWTAEE